jgi:S-adenosylmethionine-diacylgycerolhomoserine-N-methlytransferase
MDRHYRYQRFIYDQTRSYYLFGRQHLRRRIAPPPGGCVLEVGCGTAWNLVQAARLYPEARFFGLDVSRAMLEVAALSLRRRGLEGRITLRQGDATGFDPAQLFGRTEFDRVFFSYALSMIPRWELALEVAARCVAPGGELHVVDFGQCQGLPAMLKRTIFAFLRHYTVEPRATLELQLGALAARQQLVMRFERMHRGYTEYGVLLRPAA